MINRWIGSPIIFQEVWKWIIAFEVHYRTVWFASAEPQVSLTVTANEKLHNEKRTQGKKKAIFVCPSLFTTGFFLFFFHFTNSFQWLSNWKMEMLLLPSISTAASWQQSNFLSSGINGIEQYILIKKPMIAGLPVCHLPAKSSPSSPSRVLSDLIMSRIKSRKKLLGEAYSIHTEGSYSSAEIKGVLAAIQGFNFD